METILLTLPTCFDYYIALPSAAPPHIIYCIICDNYTHSISQQKAYVLTQHISTTLALIVNTAIIFDCNKCRFLF